MEALMLSVMLAICAQTGLPMPNPPIGIAYAPVPYDADPLVRYDPMDRTILLDLAFSETNPDHRAQLAEMLTSVMKDAAVRSAKAAPQGAPFQPVARPVVTVSGSR